MRHRVCWVIAIAALLLLCRTASQPGMAKVVRDGDAAASNPAVEAGGHHLTPQPPPSVPYSFIGALVAEGNWLSQCPLWPWPPFTAMAWLRHHGRDGGHARLIHHPRPGPGR